MVATSVGEQELLNKIKILEAELLIKRDESETYKKLLQQVNNNIVKINKTNAKIIKWVAIPSILAITFISAMLLYGYFWTSYDYGIQNNTTNKIENSQSSTIDNK